MVFCDFEMFVLGQKLQYSSPIHISQTKAHCLKIQKKHCRTKGKHLFISAYP